MICLTAENRHIVRYSLYSLPVIANLNSILIASDCPWVTVSCPVVGCFCLKSVFHSLFEQSILISNSVTIKRKIHRSCTVQETSRKTSKSSVAKGSVLYFFKVGKTLSHFIKNLFSFIINSYAHKVIEYTSANQKLH